MSEWPTTDHLIPGVAQQVVRRIDSDARLAGLPRNENLRRVILELADSGTDSSSCAGPFRATGLMADLDDETMHAWFCGAMFGQKRLDPRQLWASLTGPNST